MRWNSSGIIRRPPGFIELCLPTLARACVPSGPQWAFENQTR
jgi:hypothetical protein